MTNSWQEIPQRQPTNGAEQKASEFKARLAECLERDEQGRRDSLLHCKTKPRSRALLGHLPPCSPLPRRELLVLSPNP